MKYYNTKKKFRTERIIKKYPDVSSWSKALNDELAKIMSKMNTAELSYLLNNTQGMFRTIIKQYLDAARTKESIRVHEEETNNDLATTIAI